jgi:hypothetical protein
VFSLLVFGVPFFNALLYALKKVTAQDITYRLKIIGIFVVCVSCCVSFVSLS